MKTSRVTLPLLALTASALLLPAVSCEQDRTPPGQTAAQTAAQTPPTPAQTTQAAQTTGVDPAQAAAEAAAKAYMAAMQRGEAAVSAKQWDGATQAFGEAIKADPRAPQPHLRLASVLLYLKRAEDARRAALDGLRRAQDASQRGEALFVLGQVAEQTPAASRKEAWQQPEWFYELALKNEDAPAVRARFGKVAPKQLETYDKMLKFHEQNAERASECPDGQVRQGPKTIEALCEELSAQAADLEQLKDRAGVSCERVKALEAPASAAPDGKGAAAWLRAEVLRVKTARQENYHLAIVRSKDAPVEAIRLLNTFTPEVGGVRERASLDALALVDQAQPPGRWVHVRMTRSHSDLDARKRLFFEDVSVAHMLCDAEARPARCKGFMEAESFSTSATMFSAEGAAQDDYILLERRGYQLELVMTGDRLQANVRSGQPSPCAEPIVGPHKLADLTAAPAPP